MLPSRTAGRGSGCTDVASGGRRDARLAVERRSDHESHTAKAHIRGVMTRPAPTPAPKPRSNSWLNGKSTVQLFLALVGMVVKGLMRMTGENPPAVLRECLG